MIGGGVEDAAKVMDTYTLSELVKLYTAASKTRRRYLNAGRRRLRIALGKLRKKLQPMFTLMALQRLEIKDKTRAAAVDRDKQRP